MAEFALATAAWREAVLRWADAIESQDRLSAHGIDSEIEAAFLRMANASVEDEPDKRAHRINLRWDELQAAIDRSIRDFNVAHDLHPTDAERRELVLRILSRLIR